MDKASKKVILVVEDEPDIRQFAMRTLELEGFSVTGVSDAEAGWEALRRSVPALILLDLRLPKDDGWSLLEKAKSHPDTAGIPVVVFSASAGVDSKNRARDLGAEAFLVKPVTAQALVDAVIKILGKP